MYGDESGYVCYGTALQNAADIGASWKAVIKDPAVLRSLPVYKQKAVDEQGRTRFHGAFTGGFSAGYHNTVGSAAGFTPAEFTSSRGNRAAAKQQTVLNFYDEDEVAEQQKAAVHTKDLYDTYGAGTREAAASKAQAELASRPGLVSGLVDELLPVADSAGMLLLRKMGWRPGRGVGIQSSNQVAGAKWGSVSGVSVENTPLYVLEPKSGVHGLGYDPYAGAEEFREAQARKRQRPQGSSAAAGGLPSGKRSRGVAFGSGPKDEDDAGVMDDYVEEGGAARLGYSFELMSESDDEDRFDPSRAARPLLLQQGVPAKMLQHRSSTAGASFVAGYVMEKGLLETQLPEPAPVPPNFDPRHRFPPKASAAADSPALPPPPEVAPPSDPTLKKEVESLAAQVARSGPTLEKMAYNMAAKGTGFLFLQGGEGLNYYKWRLHKIKSAFDAVKGLSDPAAPPPPPESSVPPSKTPLTVQQRMELLGEEALPSSSAPAAHTDLPAVSERKPLIAESDRQRLQAALSSNFVKGDTQEEAKIQPGLRTDPVVPSAAAALAASFSERFTSSSSSQPVIEANATSFVQRAGAAPSSDASAQQAPKRSIFEWRPEPLLCKRFNVPDPYKGKPPPPPIIQQLSHLSRSDMLALPDTAAQLAVEQAEATRTMMSKEERTGKEEAATKAAAGQGAAGLDAKSLASQFLSSLEHMLLAPDDDDALPLPPRPEPPEASTAPPAPAGGATEPPAPIDLSDSEPTPAGGEELGGLELTKPLDLFKAIFEADDDEEQIEDEEQSPEPPLPPAASVDVAATADARPKKDPAADDVVPAGPPAIQPVVANTAIQRPPAKVATPSELGAALLKAQQVAAQQLRDRSHATATVPGPGPSRVMPPAESIPSARRQEDVIREALKELKRTKHKSKKKHKKGSSKKGKEGKKKGGKDKDKKSKKHKKSKSKSEARHGQANSTDESSSDDSDAVSSE